MNENGRKTIVLPADYTLDDVAGASWYIEVYRRMSSDVEVIFFSHNTPTDNSDYYYVDCGLNEYQARKCASVLEVVMKDFPNEQMRSEAAEKLLDVLGRNNKTGFLRKRQLSLAWALRYARVIDRNPKKVFDKALTVVSVYLMKLSYDHLISFNSSVEHLGEGSEMLSKVKAELQELADTTELSFEDFTLPWYMAAMEFSGLSKTEIRDTMNYWLRYFRALEKAKKEAEAGEGIASEFEISGCGMAKLIVSDNPFIAEAQVSGNAAMAVVWTEEGNVTILVNHRTGLSLAKLAHNLELAEPDLWYYNKRTESLHNGSPRRPKAPTAIEPAALVALIRKNI